MRETAGKRPWNTLERLAQGAERVLIAAPYVKEDALRRLLGVVAGGAAVTCVTRWRRADVVSGASDVACRALVADRGGRFLLHQRLHAKFYRFGNAILIGSANLTASGMGYASPANAEILCDPGPGFDAAAFAREIVSSAREVSDAEFARWEAIVRVPAARRAIAGEPAIAGEWRPAARSPGHVWLAYAGYGESIASPDEQRLAQQDLEVLRLPPDLARTDFEALLGADLLSSAAVGDVMKTDGLPDETAWTQLAETWGVSRSEAQRFRETAWNWIRAFLGPRPGDARPF